ncbi:hypothetical protein, partial [Mesorhizobium sp. LSJC285A00]
MDFFKSLTKALAGGAVAVALCFPAGAGGLSVGIGGSGGVGVSVGGSGGGLGVGVSVGGSKGANVGATVG